MRLQNATDGGNGATRRAETRPIVTLRTSDVADGTLPNDPDCSPQPLDVLAVYALYQQESSP